MIEVRNLVKSYGSFKAVNDINFSISSGEIYGFLGPNGAGKTTTINMLLGVIRPDSGLITLLGHPMNPDKPFTRNRIGVVPEKHPVGFWPWLTAMDYLSFFAELFLVKNAKNRIISLLKKVELYEVRNRKIREFSRGMLQRLSILRAILHDPDILLLDEPISGLDPQGVKQIRDIIIDENRDGRTIFISSHILSEVEKICHRVAIISNGKIKAEAEMTTLLSTLQTERKFCIELESVPEYLEKNLLSLSFVRECTIEGSIIFLSLDKKGDYRKDISQFLISKNLIPLSIQEKSISLEDAFITITGETVDTFTKGKSIF